MATRGWEVSRCFSSKRQENHCFLYFFIILMNMSEKNNTNLQSLLPDMSDVDEARNAFIASEIFNRKY